MKASELRDLTPEELQLKYDEIRKELFNLRMQKATGQIERPLRLRDLRRDVARLRTVINERQKAARTS